MIFNLFRQYNIGLNLQLASRYHQWAKSPISINIVNSNNYQIFGLITHQLLRPATCSRDPVLKFTRRRFIIFQWIKQDKPFFMVIRLDPVDKPRDVGRGRLQSSQFNFLPVVWQFMQQRRLVRGIHKKVQKVILTSYNILKFI